jgi:hypothetical protein
MQGLDFSIPAVTAYDRLLHRIEKGMTLLFAISDYIDGASLDTADMMERCMRARDNFVAYTNIITNLMHFSLCVGFAADFAISITAGVFDAVPWAGVVSLCLALVTPIQGGIGVVGDLFTSKRFALRLKEVKVPAFLASRCSSRFPILGQPSFIIKFGPIGARFQQASFYLAMINGFLSLIIVGVSWLTASMYTVEVKAKWAELSVSMPGFSMEDAMSRVTGVVSGLGDSCAGLFVILASGVTTAAYDLGGLSWLVVHVVEMEKFFVIGTGLMISGIAAKTGVEFPAGNFLFAPMGLTGAVTTLFGAVQAVPWFQKKMPDLMHFVHKAQLAVVGFLGVVFVALIQIGARGVSSFVEENWGGCHYQLACSLVGRGDFSLSQYASDENLTREDLTRILQPLFYASGISCLMTCLLILGGSNLARYMYYQSVLSRQEEIAAMRNGEGTADIRRDALVTKVRRVREQDIEATAAEMREHAIIGLEEEALVQEFATGVPMEEIYDIVRHDAIVSEIETAASVEKMVGDPSRGLEALCDDPGSTDHFDAVVRSRRTQSPPCRLILTYHGIRMNMAAMQ